MSTYAQSLNRGLALAVLCLNILFHASIGLAASQIDAVFRFSRLSKAGPNTRNELSGAYQEFLSKSMYSRCKWYPSDSQYLKLASTKCGPGIGSILAVSRFMNEYNAALFNKNTIKHNNEIHFVDFGISCGSL